MGHAKKGRALSVAHYIGAAVKRPIAKCVTAATRYHAQTQRRHLSAIICQSVFKFASASNCDPLERRNLLTYQRGRLVALRQYQETRKFRHVIYLFEP
jgi:hypothetical protein